METFWRRLRLLGRTAVNLLKGALPMNVINSDNDWLEPTGPIGYIFRSGTDDERRQFRVEWDAGLEASPE